MWINGLTQHQALWLIKEKILCFIIHSYTPADLNHYRLHDLPSIPSFVQWSEAELLKPENNGYAFVALKHGQIRSEILSDLHISRAAPNMNLIEPLRGLSISYNQGWSGVPGVTRTFHCFSPERKLFPDLPPEDAAAATSSDSPAFPPSKFQLPPPVTESVDKERSPWLVPPKIDDVNNRNWSHWEMSSNDEGNDCVRRLARNVELLGTIVYDRALKRKILLEGEAVVPAGVVAADIYGFPGPDIPYEEQGNKGWKEVARSRWLYFSQLPIPGQIGKSATRPKPDQLPFLPSVNGKVPSNYRTRSYSRNSLCSVLPIEEASPGQDKPEAQPDPTPALTSVPIENPKRISPSSICQTVITRPLDNQSPQPSRNEPCKSCLWCYQMTVSSQGRAAFVKEGR
jgi:hypothetical protein